MLYPSYIYNILMHLSSILTNIFSIFDRRLPTLGMGVSQFHNFTPFTGGRGRVNNVKLVISNTLLLWSNGMGSEGFMGSKGSFFDSD